MNESDNIVALPRSGVDKPTAASPVDLDSPVIAGLRRLTAEQLSERLKQAFSKADDSLFTTAERAHQQEEQDGLFQALRLLRVERHKVAERFREYLDQAFGLTRVLSTDSAPSEGLSLVHNDELEQLVAADSMTANAKRECSRQISELCLRLNTLYSRKVHEKNLPMGPDMVCDAFIEALRPLELHIRARLTLLKKFEQELMEGLEEFYDACNRLLIDKGVLPNLSEGRKARVRKSAQSAPEQRREHQGPGTVPVGAGVPIGMGLLPVGTVGVPAMPAEDLLSHLAALQAQQGGADSASLELLDIAQMLRYRLAEAQKAASLTKADNDVIRLVELLFSFILEDRNLADEVKALLGRLQLPLLKVAVSDKSFFSTGGHPARKLLNALADAATGWQAGKNLQSDRLYREICRVTDRVVNEFDRDLNLFSDLLEEFESFITRERKRAETLERRVIDEADGRAKALAARAKVAAVLDALSAGRELPSVVSEWLEKVWSNAMFLTCIREGVESEAWSRDLRAARDLVWSVQAPMPESRSQLYALLPSLQERLKAAVGGISLSPVEGRRLFAELKEVYRERFAITEPERPVEEPLEAVESAVVEGQLDAGVAASNEEAPVSEALPPVVESAVAGVELTANETPTVEAPLAVTEDADPEVQVEAPATAEAVADEATASDVAGETRQLLDTAELAEVAEQAEVHVDPEVAATLEELSEDDPHWKQTFRMAQGSWFEFHRAEDDQFRCRLAAVIRDIDQFIFVNRNGAKVAQFSRLELAHALRASRLMPLDDGMLFERALQSVISNVRKGRDQQP